MLLLVVCLLLSVVSFSACAPADPVVTGIEITTKPSKTEYFSDETFSLEGGVLTATYDNGETETKKLTDEGVEVTEPKMTLSDPEKTPSEKKNVTVRYGGKRADFSITVTIRKFTVTFDLGYDGKTETDSVMIDKPAQRPADPTRTDYIFDDWYSDAALTIAYDFDSEVTKDTTVYAKWLEDATYYDFIFNYNQDLLSIPSVTQKVKEGDKAVRLSVDPTRIGYRFDGWCSDAAGTTALFDFDTAINANKTVYAKWTKTASGRNTYVFEAEDTNLLGKNWPSWSGTVSNTGLIHMSTEFGASNDRFIGYMYEQGCSLEFQIVSDSAVSDATLVFSFSAEFNMEFDSSMFVVSVNQQPMTYDKITYTGIVNNNDGVLKCPRFKDYTIATNVTLKKGFNIITVVTQNEADISGTTYKAYAPLVDCLKLTTEAVVVWNDSLGLPKKNY